MDTTPHLVTCDWCKCSVSKKKIDKHKALKCPKAPAEIIAARPKPQQQAGFRVKIKDGNLTLFYPESPASDRLPTTPTPQDRQINPEARVSRSGDGSFYVHNVLSAGGSWHHPLQVECQHCHHMIELKANGPCDMPKFAQDEACRLALLEHLRIDDARPYHSPAH